MSVLDDLLPDIPDPLDVLAVRAGTVLDTATAVDDLVRVRLNVDTDQYVGPMSFMPKPAAGTVSFATWDDLLAGVTTGGWLLPQAGDLGLVAFDDESRPWLISWRAP